MTKNRPMTNTIPIYFCRKWQYNCYGNILILHLRLGTVLNLHWGWFISMMLNFFSSNSLRVRTLVVVVYINAISEKVNGIVLVPGWRFRPIHRKWQWYCCCCWGMCMLSVSGWQPLPRTDSASSFRLWCWANRPIWTARRQTLLRLSKFRPKENCIPF